LLRVHLPSTGYKSIGLRWYKGDWKKEFNNRAAVIRITGDAVNIMPWSDLNWPRGIALVEYQHLIERDIHIYLVAGREFPQAVEGGEYCTVGLEICKSGQVKLNTMGGGTVYTFDLSHFIVHG
jgi:hypothetical protein